MNAVNQMDRAVSVHDPLRSNPFFLLSVSTRDDRRRIVEAADEKALHLDPEVCSKARSDLTNPRIRLGAEISWLVGLSPRRATDLLDAAAKHPTGIHTLEGLPPLAHANLLSAALLAFGPDAPSGQWTAAILRLGLLVEQIDSEDVLHDLNADREIAGFPAVKSLDLIEDALAEQRRRYRDGLKEALDVLPPAKLAQVVTAVVEEATRSGEAAAPVLIDEMVDAYQLETHSFLNKEAENIRLLIEHARAAVSVGDHAVDRVLERLERVLRNWDLVAQPIQLSAKSRGLPDGPSEELAREVRSLGIDLFNEHGKLEAAQRIVSLLQDVFDEVPEIAARLKEDADTVERLFAQREQASEEAKEWAREITYRVEVGALFKTTLAISPGGLEWGDAKFPLDEVKAVRWGGTRHSINGIPTGTTYNISFGDGRRLASVGIRKSAIYQNYVDRLWKAVGVRLLTEMLADLRNGKKLRFGGAIVDDEGMILERRRFFGANEPVRCSWNELVIWSADGAFCIARKGDKRVSVTLPYLTVDNVHILEAAMRMFWKKPGRRISDLLSDRG